MGFRSSSSTNFTGTTTLAATAPAGYAAHDRLYAFMTQDSPGTVTPPSGGSGNTAWALLSSSASNPASSPDGQYFGVFELKDATGSDSFTWTTTSVNGCIIQIVALQGMNNSAASVLATPTLSTAHNATPIALAITGLTAAINSSLILAADTDQENVNTETWSYDTAAGFTQRQNVANSDWCSLTLQTLDTFAGGATGTVTLNATRTAGINTAGYGGYLISVPVAGPTIVTQPTSQTVNAGATATFTVSATTNGGTVTYQWQDDSGGSFANISGATSASYALSSTTFAMQGRRHQVLITDSTGTQTSSIAKLTVAYQLGGTGPRVSPLYGAPHGAGAYDYEQGSIPLGDQPAEDDGWDWNGDYAELDPFVEIDAATSQPVGTDAVTLPALQPQDDFTAEHEYEDPLLDILESSAGPVQPGAPPSDQPQDDAWNWNEVEDLSDLWPDESAPVDSGDMPQVDTWPWEDAAEDDFASSEDPVGPNQPPVPAEEAWPFWDEPADESEPDPSTDPVGPDQPPLPAEQEWPTWDDDPGEEAPSADDPVGPDQPPVPGEEQPDDPFETDDWWQETEFALVNPAVAIDSPVAADDDFAEDVGDDTPDESGPVVANAIDQPVATDWWDEEAIDEIADESSPVVADVAVVASDPPASDPWSDEDAADETIDESAPVVADGIVALPGDDDFAEDVGDETPEDSGPVGANAIDPPTAEDWWLDDADDAALDESAPVGPDTVVAADQPTQEAWWEDDSAEEAADDSAPVGADLALATQPPQEDWLEEDAPDEAPDESGPVADSDLAASDDFPFDDPAEDALDVDTYLNEDEPPLANTEPWRFDDEDQDADDWWHGTEFALLDVVLLPTLSYQETWDWSGDDTDDDAQWQEQPQPDAAGIPADTCPIQLAIALARIAELEALLAAALALAGTGGGGASGDGDDVDGGEGEQRDILRRRQEDNQRRIDRNNAFIMSIAAATVRGFKKPEGPT